MLTSCFCKPEHGSGEALWIDSFSNWKKSPTQDMIITVREGLGRESESLITAAKGWTLCMSSAEMKRGKEGESTGSTVRFWRLLVILLMIMSKHLEVFKSLKG